MPPNETDTEKGPPSAAPSRSDVDFDPDLDVAPEAKEAASRPDLAAALAGADEELRWAGDVKPSEQQAYLKPTTVPRGLVAPTVDMSAVRVRDGLDPRKAMTVRIGGERAAEAPPSSAAVSGAAPSGTQRRSWGIFVGGGAVVALVGLFVVRAGLSGAAGSEGPDSGATASSLGSTQACGACSACGSSSVVAASTGAGASAGTSTEVPSAAIETSTGSAPSVPVSTGAAPVSTGAAPAPVGPLPSSPSTAQPRATSSTPSNAISTSAAPSLPSSAPAVVPSGTIPTAQPSAPPKPSVAPAPTGKVVTPLFKPE